MKSVLVKWFKKQGVRTILPTGGRGAGFRLHRGQDAVRPWSRHGQARSPVVRRLATQASVRYSATVDSRSPRNCQSVV